MSSSNFSKTAVKRATRTELGLTEIQLDYQQQRKEQEVYESELSRQDGLESLSEEEISRIDTLFGGDGFHKRIYGDKTAVELVRDYGCKFARRTYHEAVAGPLAAVYAQEARDLVDKVGRRSAQRPPIIEFHTGSGALAYAFTELNFDFLHTVDINPTILKWAKENLEKLGCSVDSIKWHNRDAIEFINSTLEKGKMFDLAIADPPWKGELKKFDSFAVMSPNGAQLVKKLQQFTEIVGLKAPGTFPDGAAFGLADELRGKAYSLVCHFTDGSKKYTEKFLFFLSKNIVKKNGIVQHQITEREVNL